MKILAGTVIILFLIAVFIHPPERVIIIEVPIKEPEMPLEEPEGIKLPNSVYIQRANRTGITEILDADIQGSLIILYALRLDNKSQYAFMHGREFLVFFHNVNYQTMIFNSSVFNQIAFYKQDKEANRTNVFFELYRAFIEFED